MEDAGSKATPGRDSNLFALLIERPTNTASVVAFGRSVDAQLASKTC